MPTESFDHGRTAALLTELNRAGRKASGDGKTALFAAFTCGIVVMAAGIVMPPPPRITRAPIAAVSRSAPPPAHMRRRHPSSGDSLLAAPDLSAPLPAARSVVTAPATVPTDAGPALEPDMDGDLAIMPKAPMTLVRTPAVHEAPLAGQGVG